MRLSVLFALGLGGAFLACKGESPTTGLTEIPARNETTVEVIGVDTLTFPDHDGFDPTATRYYPTYKFVKADPDECSEEHWHSRAPVPRIGSTFTSGTFIPSILNADCTTTGSSGTPRESDMEPFGCGHGTVASVVRVEIIMAKSALDRYVQCFGAPE